MNTGAAVTLSLSAAAVLFTGGVLAQGFTFDQGHQLQQRVLSPVYGHTPHTLHQDGSQLYGLEKDSSDDTEARAKETRYSYDEWKVLTDMQKAKEQEEAAKQQQSQLPQQQAAAGQQQSTLLQQAAAAKQFTPPEPSAVAASNPNDDDSDIIIDDDVISACEEWIAQTHSGIPEARQSGSGGAPSFRNQGPTDGSLFVFGD